MLSFTSFATTFAYQAGDIIRQNFSKTKDVTFKDDNTVLTETDTLINHILIEAVQKNFPDHSVHGEEEDYIQNNSEYTRVCDPIDGTTAFTIGVPVSTFGIALLHNNNIILGVIYDPYMDRLYIAEQGKGATCNSKPIRVSQETNVQKHYVSVGQTGKKYNLNSLWTDMKNNNQKLMSAISIQYYGSLVAAGKMLGCIFGGTTIHDMAPIKILVEEAGGTVTDLFGNSQDYSTEVKGMIASNGLIHKTLVEIVQKNMRIIS